MGCSPSPNIVIPNDRSPEQVSDSSVKRHRNSTAPSGPTRMVHPLPPRPQALVSHHEDSTNLNGAQGKEFDHHVSKRKRGSADVSAKAESSRHEARRSREHTDNGMDEGRDMLDSWVAPDVATKRLKVSEIFEWDTWIAPDLREEQERVERQATARTRRTREREKDRKRRSRRTRYDPQSLDTWIASPRGKHGNEDDDKRTRGPGQLEDTAASPRRVSRERPRHRSPVEPIVRLEDSKQARMYRDIPPHMSALSPNRRRR